MKQRTISHVAPWLHHDLIRLQRDIEITDLAAEVAPDTPYSTLTRSTNTLRRVAAELGMPGDSLDALLQVPWPLSNGSWGIESAALWEAMSARALTRGSRE